MYVSPRSRTRGLQRFAFLKYYNALKWENWLQGWTLPKLPIVTKNASNKSCSELNFLQKSQRVKIKNSSINISSERKIGDAIVWRVTILNWEAKHQSCAMVNFNLPMMLDYNFKGKYKHSHPPRSLVSDFLHVDTR